MARRGPGDYIYPAAIPGAGIDRDPWSDLRRRTCLPRASIGGFGTCEGPPVVVSTRGGVVLGLASGMLRLTHEAPLSTLFRYGRAIIGSDFPVGVARALNTRIANVAARSISGASRSARVAIPHATAGVHSAENLCFTHCALPLAGALRSHGSSIKERVMAYLGPLYGVPSWGVLLIARAFRRVGAIGEEWLVFGNTISSCLVLPPNAVGARDAVGTRCK